MERMITEQDIAKLKKVFATKDELHFVRTDINRLHEEMQLGFGEVKEDIKLLVTNTQAMAGMIQDLIEENRAGAVILSRHTRQIEALAATTGTILPE